MIGGYLTDFAEYIGGLDLSLDVTKTRLYSYLASVILVVTTSTDASICPLTSMEYAHPRRVQILIDSSFMKAVLITTNPESTTRQRIGAALFRAASTLLRKDVHTMEKRRFRKLMTSVVLLIKTFKRCLNWPVNGTDHPSIHPSIYPLLL